MPTKPRRLLLRPLLLLPLIAAAILGPVQAARAADRQKQVLVVYSTRRNAQVVVVGDRELPGLLSTGVGQEVDYYSEHLDVSRFPDRDYQDTFSSFLATKYKGHRFDVIVAMQDVAIEFLEQARNSVFPGTPIVYFSTSPSTPRRAELHRRDRGGGSPRHRELWPPSYSRTCGRSSSSAVHREATRRTRRWRVRSFHRSNPD